MLDPELLEILVCPEMKIPVRLADQPLLDRVNAEVDEGRLVTRGGSRVEARITAALVREDGRVLYPIQDGIPVMLIDEAISLDSLK